MNLGTFSISLAVKNIDKSISFYTHLGFKVVDGGHLNEGFKDSETMKWRILANSSVKIGLFQGMFNSNILTFNPKDVLKLQEVIKEKGISFIKEAKASDAIKSIILADPDGNQIMLDQH
ncbi:VOC family protein [Aquimarina algiphila]|uniref:VOC family protein n=1 Tax=Aquimarina algiphila TaxID=2047982 RepID=A0A554VQR0_9FLAO|nr:VOC family protein [Aquimarina algiphila]TSE10828.1 VOC family protein [Aquimarina algiphila]